MSWIKQIFTDFQTVITAQFLNDLQDQIIADETAVNGMVKGVKGDAEDSYRHGDVNLTKANIGLGNVDNTSDANKPVSTAQQTALDGKVDKVTGKGLSTNDYTNEEKSKLSDLPTKTALDSSLDRKVDKVEGKGLSTNDYTDAEKQRVADAALQSDLDALDDRVDQLYNGGVLYNTASGSIASFNDGADNMPIRKIVGTIVPVQAGSGDPSPDNVRPISGWTGANVKQTADNAPSFYTFTGTVNQSKAATVTQLSPNSFSVSATNIASSYPASKQLLSEYSNLVLGRRYRVSAHAKVTSGTALIAVRNSSNYDLIESNYLTTDGDVEIVFTLTSAMDYLSFFAGYNQSIGYVVYSDIKFQEVVTLSINWESEALTVYGGTVTLNEDGSADLVSEWVKVSFPANGAGWSYKSSGGYWTSISKTLDIEPYSDRTSPAGDGNGMFNYGTWSYDKISSWRALIYSTTEMRIVISDHSFSTKDAVMSFLGTLSDELEVVYKIKTPFTYHFDNVGQLKTFLGVNNVWCDTGDITELEYCADTKLFLTARDEEITGNIAPIENGTTASKDYAQGEYFWHDTKFCKALTAIASEATFTLGTNYQETTVAAELLAAQN